MGRDAVAVVVGARLATRANDTEYPFRQDSDFWYLTGFDHPDAIAVLRTDGGPPFTLFVQAREKEAEIWTGYRPGVEGAKADFGADEAFPVSELADEIPKCLAKAKRVYHQLGRDAKLDALVVGALDSMRRRSRQGVVAAPGILDPRELVHELRLFKSEDELARMRRAAAITAEAHREAARLARDGVFEYELEAVLDYTYRRRGGWGPAYGTIVAGGANATVLHYVRNDARLRAGDLVLVDSGCELEGYASDVTRTYPVGGRYSAPCRAVYEVVLEAQRAALALCRPGATLPEIHRATVRTLVEGMVSLGLLHGTVDDLVAKEAHRAYYMHNTSHWLGLDVHDAGSYTKGDDARPLEPGMVFTVEPGLYVAKDDANAPESLRGIGVRIEDDVVVTADGCENLNTAIPKRIDEVEAWIAG
ncbi:MAG: Xaa-Pro aminopeptidase [Myxococcales bacterium]|nr:Xaa-Pro aminopeptidase [Myxococcales bacterium]